jgi:hypothetical protein
VDINIVLETASTRVDSAYGTRCVGVVTSRCDERAGSDARLRTWHRQTILRRNRGWSMRKIIVVASVVAVGFAMVPADKVAPYTEYKPVYTKPDDNGRLYKVNYGGEPVQGTDKSGLRMAIEGRFKWLGLYPPTSSPCKSSNPYDACPAD